MEDAVPAEDEDADLFQDELQAAAHLKVASETIRNLVRRVNRSADDANTAPGLRQGKYDELHSLVVRAVSLMNEMKQATEDSIIEKIQKHQAAATANSTISTDEPGKRFINPMVAEQEDAHNPGALDTE